MSDFDSIIDATLRTLTPAEQEILDAARNSDDPRILNIRLRGALKLAKGNLKTAMNIADRLPSTARGGALIALQSLREHLDACVAMTKSIADERKE